MPELRKDPIIDRWVIISTDRGRRPQDYPPLPPKQNQKDCPFCPGHEDKTPPEIFAFRPTNTPRNTPGWTLRVVPNKYPALMIEGDLDREGQGMFDKMNGVGAHEVIIEHVDHTKELADLSFREVEDVIWAFLGRSIDLKQDPRFRYILIFKNQGEAAGASLEHTHSQLIATPIIPMQVQNEIRGSRDYFAHKERCIFCDAIHQNIKENVRVVMQNERFITFEPYAPCFPFETWILPKFHASAFDSLKKQDVVSLAQILKDTLMCLHFALNIPPYNFIIHTAPLHDNCEEYYHWHFEIVPRLTRVAGFEWGSGFFINPVSPEEAAQILTETCEKHKHC